jgi:hypothetical protein
MGLRVQIESFEVGHCRDQAIHDNRARPQLARELHLPAAGVDQIRRLKLLPVVCRYTAKICILAYDPGRPGAADESATTRAHFVSQ